MAKRTITIAGEQFEVTIPFETGHVCTEAEAKALNQTRCENIRNNMAKWVKAANDPDSETTVENAIDAIAEYNKNYEFTLASVGNSRTLDPIEKEARSLARDAIKVKLAADGRKLGDVDKEKLAEAIAATAAQPNFVKAAKKRIADRQKLAEEGLEAIGLTG